eukprot:6001084-Amphidinium_carterae.1
MTASHLCDLLSNGPRNLIKAVVDKLRKHWRQGNPQNDPVLFLGACALFRLMRSLSINSHTPKKY